MAVNESRSMTGELAEGRTDGMIHKIARDRGGEVDTGTFNTRESLHSDAGYGLRTREQLEGGAVRFMHGDEAIPPRLP